MVDVNTRLSAPDNPWIRHDLTLPQNVHLLSASPTILQTGAGNQSRLLRLAVIRNGSLGICEKSIRDSEWKFIPQ